MSKEICIVPTYKRPEMLFHCLRTLVGCEDVADVEFRICIDRGRRGAQITSEAQESIHAAGLVSRDRFKITIRDMHDFPGNSYNVLESYAEAYGADADFVYLVEDDVMVTPDFFRWHRTCQQKFQPFCSIGHRNIRRKEIEPGKADEILLSRSDYCSLGVCFSRASLAQIIPHATPDYYGKLGWYVSRYFPPSREFSEQDGLITRIMVREQGSAAFPYVPRAVHVGWYGYHRNEGDSRSAFTLADRIAVVGSIIRSPDLLANYDGLRLGDIASVPDETPTWSDLVLRQTLR